MEGLNFIRYNLVNHQFDYQDDAVNRSNDLDYILIENQKIIDLQIDVNLIKIGLNRLVNLIQIEKYNLESLYNNLLELLDNYNEKLIEINNQTILVKKMVAKFKNTSIKYHEKINFIHDASNEIKNKVIEANDTNEKYEYSSLLQYVCAIIKTLL